MQLKLIRHVCELLHLPLPQKQAAQPFLGFSIDSRTIEPGQIYMALKGERVDGHSFLKEIAAKGVRLGMVSSDYQGPDEGLFLWKVDDPVETLQKLVKKILNGRKSRVIAITGSVGKTITKEFVKTLLEKRFKVFASPGNQNSQIGLPLAIANGSTGEEEVLVLEMGMTNPSQLARLVEMTEPEVALITSVSLVHACNFETLEDIARAKAEIFSHPMTKLGILDREISNYLEVCQKGVCKKISFSTFHPEADFIIHSDLTLRGLEEGVLKNWSIHGEHNRHNLLAAILVARYFRLSWEEIKEQIQELKLPEKRLQFVEHKGILFLNDSYNASEISTKAALKTLPSPKTTFGKKIAVLGSMMELGKFSEECHRRVGEYALDCVEEVYCLGEECLPIFNLWKESGRPVELFNERSSLVKRLKEVLQPSDVVLIKGSRSKQLWKILEELE